MLTNGDCMYPNTCTYPQCDCEPELEPELEEDGDFESDAESASQSIDRENAAAINRDNKREHR